MPRSTPCSTGATIRPLKPSWSDSYIQHSAHIPPGREGLIADLIRASPDTLTYENQFALADADLVITYGRFSGTGRAASWIAADVVHASRTAS